MNRINYCTLNDNKQYVEIVAKANCHHKLLLVRRITVEIPIEIPRSNIGTTVISKIFSKKAKLQTRYRTCTKIRGIVFLNPFRIINSYNIVRITISIERKYKNESILNRKNSLKSITASKLPKESMTINATDSKIDLNRK